MENTPPPFFNRGLNPNVRLAFFALLSLGLIVTDLHYSYLNAFRGAIAAVIHPLQQAINGPLQLAGHVNSFFQTQASLQRENRELHERQLSQAAQTLRYQSLASENAYLRKLLKAEQAWNRDVTFAEVIHDGRDAFSRKIVIDKGVRNHVEPGQVVVDDIGVIGQVTKAYLFSSEVTLITDKDQAVPVQVMRSGVRGIVMGNGREGTLDVPFMPVNADVQPGDVLLTSGIDGTYPAGLPVATVVKVERNAALPFAKITGQPSAGPERDKALLVLAAKPRPVLPEDHKEAPTRRKKR